MRILILLLISFPFYNFSSAGEYWSNEKIYPTTVAGARNYIFSKHREIEKKTNIEFDYPLLQGIWYSHTLGFVGIYQDIDQLKNYKMFLIRSPKGYGLSKYPGYETEKLYKQNKDHEGTLEATINTFTNFMTKEAIGATFKINSKYWFLQEDGSYKYKNSHGSIEMLSPKHFKYVDKEYNKKGQYFAKVGDFWFQMVLAKISNSPSPEILEMADLEIEVGDKGVFIYFDTKVKDKTVKDKFINIDYSGEINTGKIQREIEGDFNSIDAIVCYVKGTGNGLPRHLYYYTTNSNLSYRDQKLINKNCNPSDVSYSTYMHYKNRQYYWGGGISLVLIIIFLTTKAQRSRELTEYNRNNKNKFKTYSELKEYKQKIVDRESLKQAKKDEKERKAEEVKQKKEARAEEARIKAEERKLEREERKKEKLDDDDSNDVYDDSLMEKVKRLKQLYKSGTLTKSEFEKAKNKLLK